MGYARSARRTRDREKTRSRRQAGHRKVRHRTLHQGMQGVGLEIFQRVEEDERKTRVLG